MVAIATELHDPTLIALSAVPLRQPALTRSLQMLSVGAGIRRQKGASMAQNGQGNNDPDFAWDRLDPAEGKLPGPPTLFVFQIDVKTDTDIGRALNNDPLKVFRDMLDKILPPVKVDPETEEQVGKLADAMDIRDDNNVRVHVLRVNAERPANPTKKKAVAIKYPGNTTVVVVEYKYE
jgi:hypothetical protein